MESDLEYILQTKKRLREESGNDVNLRQHFEGLERELKEEEERNARLSQYNADLQLKSERLEVKKRALENSLDEEVSRSAEMERRVAELAHFAELAKLATKISSPPESSSSASPSSTKRRRMLSDTPAGMDSQRMQSNGLLPVPRFDSQHPYPDIPHAGNSRASSDSLYSTKELWPEESSYSNETHLLRPHLKQEEPTTPEPSDRIGVSSLHPKSAEIGLFTKKPQPISQSSEPLPTPAVSLTNGDESAAIPSPKAQLSHVAQLEDPESPKVDTPPKKKIKRDRIMALQASDIKGYVNEEHRDLELPDEVKAGVEALVQKCKGNVHYEVPERTGKCLERSARSLPNRFPMGGELRACVYCTCNGKPCVRQAHSGDWVVVPVAERLRSNVAESSAIFWMSKGYRPNSKQKQEVFGKK